jgi:hypothetical protein
MSSDKAVVQAAQEAVEQVTLGSRVTIASYTAPIVVRAA